MSQEKDLFKRRQRRTRFNILQTGGERPRLSVFRSKKHIYVQVIDDKSRKTLAMASTLDKGLKLTATSNIAAAEQIGRLVGERALKAGIKHVVFDRGGYLYHGRVKALADAARTAGLSF